MNEDIIQIISAVAYAKNPPVIPKPDKEKLKKFVADYREKQEKECE